MVVHDMGFKGTGFSANPIAKTPHQDCMAAEESKKPCPDLPENERKRWGGFFGSKQS